MKVQNPEEQRGGGASAYRYKRSSRSASRHIFLFFSCSSGVRDGVQRAGTTASPRTMLTMLTSSMWEEATEGTRPRGSNGGVDGGTGAVRKERDGKEKELCCIRKLFIFLHGMVNTKEDADAFLLAAVWPPRRLSVRPNKRCSWTNIDATNHLQNIQPNIHLQWRRHHGNLHF